MKKKTLSEILDTVPDYVKLDWARMGPERVSVTIVFGETGFGFGEITFVQTRGGCYLDTECMGREGVMRFLKRLVDEAILDTDTGRNAERYDKAMGRTRCEPKVDK